VFYETLELHKYQKYEAQVFRCWTWRLVNSSSRMRLGANSMSQRHEMIAAATAENNSLMAYESRKFSGENLSFAFT
jgi:hypothetical protein